MRSLKGMLRESELMIGLTTQHVTQPWLAKLWKHSGCDFVYLEYEHGFFNEAQLADFVLSCRSEGLPVVAKVPECSRTHVAKLLECGVTGIQLPWTETKEQIEQLISYVKFPPLGIRSAALGYGNCDYEADVPKPQFIEQANRETMILAHIETRRGVENAEAILGNIQIDLAFLGMDDLSVSYGQPGNLRHPEVVQAVERVIGAARKHKKPVGMYAPDASVAREWLPKGVSFFETASEVDLIATGATSLVREFRAASTSTDQPT